MTGRKERMMCNQCVEFEDTCFAKPKKNQLRVWWIPQVPMSPFYYPVKNKDEAVVLLKVLACYDIFQFEHKIKQDYSNAGGLEVYDTNFNGEGESGWIEWCDEDGCDIDDYLEQ